MSYIDSTDVMKVFSSGCQKGICPYLHKKRINSEHIINTCVLGTECTHNKDTKKWFYEDYYCPLVVRNVV